MAVWKKDLTKTAKVCDVTNKDTNPVNLKQYNNVYITLNTTLEQ